MNNKVVLFGDAKKRKQIENVLSKHLEKNDVLFEIQSISDSEQFLKKFFFEDDFRLFMTGEKGTVLDMMTYPIRYKYTVLKLLNCTER